MAMSYVQLAEAARGKMGTWCRACPVCDGRACRDHIPGPGAKGSGTVAQRNYDAWRDWRLVMDTIWDGGDPDTTLRLFDHELALPVMVAPVGDVNRHYGPDYDMDSYNETVLKAAVEGGSVAWTGDGLNASIFENAVSRIGNLDGRGIPTIKPWSMDLVDKKLDIALAAHPIAVAMDIDGAGLPFLKGQQPPAGPKSVSELSHIARRCHDEGVPFILKGIMSERGAQKALKAGADGIVVSNHGGRVLDGVPATAEVLPQIADSVDGRMNVLVDGGIRSGIDVFRALALGADAVLVCRPFVVATYGGGGQGVRDYLSQLKDELADTMLMCGAGSLDDIDGSMLM